MASPCDLVLDALTIGDAYSTAIAQNVVGETTLTIGDAYKEAVGVVWADALTIGDAAEEMWTAAFADALTIGDAVQDHLVAYTLANDRLFIGDDTQIALTDKVSDALTIGDATSVGIAMIASDALTIGDEAQTRAVVKALMLDALRIADSAQISFSSDVEDSLTIGDAVDVRQSPVTLALDALTIGDAIQSHASVVSYAVDGLTIADDVATSLAALQLVADSLTISDAVFGGGQGGAWTAHVEPFAMSRYTGYGFTGMALVNGRLLAVNDSGVYELAGADDAGAHIAARIEHDLSDDAPDSRSGEMRNDDHLKRPRYLYASYHSTGQIAVDLGYIDENDTKNGWVERTASYTLPAMNSTQFRTGRVPLGRGIRSRYLRPVLKNVSGASFSMNEASLVVDSVKRKV